MGFCVICGKEFVDLSKAKTKKYCSGTCKYRARLNTAPKKPRRKPSTERKSYKPSYTDGWSIPPVCKRCFYRRSFTTGSYIREVLGDWSDTYCAYLELTGELRGCEAKGEHCDKFKERKGYEL